MTTITGLTAERMLEIEAASIVDGEIVGDNLILTKFDDSTIDAGDVRGPIGPAGADGEDFTPALAAGDVISWNADTNLYRGALDVLKTDDSLHVVKDLRINLDNVSKMYFGSAFDTNLYRNVADQLKTDDTFVVGGNLIASSNVFIDAGGVGGILYFGSATDTNLYRDAANVLKSDDSIISNINLGAQWGSASRIFFGDLAGYAAIQFGSSADATLYRSAAGILSILGALTISGNETVTGVSLHTGAIKADQSNVGAANGLIFGSALDTNLYRSAADTLKTDDRFRVVSYITAMDGTANEVVLGYNGAAPGPAIAFSSVGGGGTYDTNLYRSAADTLKTDDSLRVSNELWVDVSASANQLKFGSAGDTNLYRSGADVLKTDDEFRSAVDIYARSGTNQVRLTSTKIEFGSAADTNLYRSAADTLKTDDRFQAALGLDLLSDAGTAASGIQFGSTQDSGIYRFVANFLKTDDTFASTLELYAVYGGANQIKLASTGKIEFGSGLDTNLYRSAADTLKTDDAFIVTGDLTPQGRYTSFTHANAELLFGAAGDVSLGRPGVANVLRLGDGDSLQLGYTPSTGNFIEFFEQTADPAAATANAARLFAKDNGAGKTQLVVRFQSGATQVLATEP